VPPRRLEIEYRPVICKVVAFYLKRKKYRGRFVFCGKKLMKKSTPERPGSPSGRDIRVARFFLAKCTKMEKIFKMTPNYTKLP
jgi:hypothetical protein